MNKVCVKRKSTRASNRDELMKMSKEELVDKIIQLEAHNVQLRNIISKGLKSEEIKVQNKKNSFDFSKCNFRRILLRIMYFGWDYQGLAVQEDTTKTIEHHLFSALTKSCLIQNRESAQYHRCGRTDKGVSSFGQVISIRVRSKYPETEQYNPENITNEMAYCKMINRLLPPEIRAVSWMPIPSDKPEFSARFNCIKRVYKYYFPRSDLDLAAMCTACAHLVGSHDFRNICKMDVSNGVTEFVREIKLVDIVLVDSDNGVDDATSMYCLLIEGNAFLWHQIRCIFGLLLLVGTGKEGPDVVRELLDVEKNPRKPQYNMALDIPLNLFECHYEDLGLEWVYDSDEVKSVISLVQGFWTLHSVKSTMIKNCLRSLEEQYGRLRPPLDGASVMSHTECLLQGVKPKTYKPLLERVMCSSLEEKIDHYRRKRKLVDVNEELICDNNLSHNI